MSKKDLALLSDMEPHMIKTPDDQIDFLEDHALAEPDLIDTLRAGLISNPNKWTPIINKVFCEVNGDQLEKFSTWELIRELIRRLLPKRDSHISTAAPALNKALAINEVIEAEKEKAAERQRRVELLLSYFQKENDIYWMEVDGKKTSYHLKIDANYGSVSIKNTSIESPEDTYEVKRTFDRILNDLGGGIFHFKFDPKDIEITFVFR